MRIVGTNGQACFFHLFVTEQPVRITGDNNINARYLLCNFKVLFSAAVRQQNDFIDTLFFQLVRIFLTCFNFIGKMNVLSGT